MKDMKKSLNILQLSCILTNLSSLFFVNLKDSKGLGYLASHFQPKYPDSMTEL